MTDMKRFVWQDSLLTADALLHLSSGESPTHHFRRVRLLGRRRQLSEVGKGVMSRLCKHVARCFLDFFTSKVNARRWPITSISAAMAIHHPTASRVVEEVIYPGWRTYPRISPPGR